MRVLIGGFLIVVIIVAITAVRIEFDIYPESWSAAIIVGLVISWIVGLMLAGYRE